MARCLCVRSLCRSSGGRSRASGQETVRSCVQCSDHDVGMPEGVRRALMDRAAKTPRHGLEVNLYPNTYYGFAIRGDRRGRDERDRCPTFR